jgi:glutamate racemase
MERESDMRQRSTRRGALAVAVLATLALTPLLTGCHTHTAPPRTFATAARERADITIVVTDSGLGGLSVVAELATRLPASGIARSARIVFVNALLDDAIGYNDLKRESDKLRVFDAALSAMESRYHPDLILVACNTLSVLYDGTRHAKEARTPVVGIVGIGADLIARQLAEKSGSTAVIFATRTTIDSDAHRRLLVQKGFPSSHIVGQACHRLAGSIERGAGSDETKAYVRTFVAEAIQHLPKKPGPLVVSLNCTHYGYVRSLWEETFAAAGFPGVKVLDPNPLMADFVVKEGGPRRYPDTSVTVEVVSKVPIGPDVQASLGTLLRTVSPPTANALASYRLDPGLFSVMIDPSAIVK